MSDPRYAAQREQNRISGATTNPNAKPFGIGRQQAAQEIAQSQSNGTPAPAPSITPRIDSNPVRSNADAVATSNRSGAFGTGAANLQGRKDLYAEMGASKKGFDTPDFKARAQALGVTESGWANAARKLSPSWGAAPTAAPAAGAIATQQNQGNQSKLTTDAPAPNPPPSLPLPGQTKVGQPPAPAGGITWNGNPAAATWNKPASFQPVAPAMAQPAQPVLASSAQSSPRQATPATPAPAFPVAQPAAQPGAILRPAIPGPSWAATAGIHPDPQQGKPAPTSTPAFPAAQPAAQPGSMLRPSAPGPSWATTTGIHPDPQQGKPAAIPPIPPSMVPAPYTERDKVAAALPNQPVISAPSPPPVVANGGMSTPPPAKKSPGGTRKKQTIKPAWLPARYWKQE